MADQGGSGGGGLLEAVRYELTWHDAPPVDWRVRRMLLLEAISEPYVLHMELITRELDADVDALLGAACTLTLSRAGPSRAVHGIVAEVEVLAAEAEQLRVQVEVVPALALLDQRRDTRFWQDMTAIEIVQEVLGDPLGALGREVTLELDAQYPKREYCVQYRETDLEFVRRLLREEGVHFYFKHELDAQAEVLTLLDPPSRAPELVHAELSELPYVPEGTGTAPTESVAAFDRRRGLRGTSAVQRDWDWLRAGDGPLEHERRGKDDRKRDREGYEFDDRRLHADDGERRARRKLEGTTGLQDRALGRSDVTALVPGYTMKLTLHPRHELDGEYLLARVEHHGEAPDEQMFAAESEGPRYTNSFECVRANVPLRPAHAPARPRVHGPHTAVVVGPPGEEIHTDEHGRIKVRFHWDRISPPDDTASCWIRVAQTWSGPGWGSVVIPRIGMEVLVEFIDGDPDRPLVTGCVYNQVNRTPYPLPDQKTKSTVKSDSSPGGGGFNEITFEDAKGSEELFIHAQRDMKTVVLRDGGRDVGRDDAHSVGRDQTESVTNNRTSSVGVDESMTVGSNQTLSVGSNQSTSIGANHSVSVGGNQSVSVGGNRSLAVQGNRSATVAGTDTLSVNGARSVTVGGGQTETITGGATLSVTGAHTVSVSAAASETIGAARTVTVGAAQTHNVAAAATLTAASVSQAATGTYNISAGGALTITAGPSADLGAVAVTISGSGSVTVSAGGGAIKLTPGGVEINGPSVKIAGGSIDITGGIVKIN